jgi:hypothetical protein
MRCGSAAGRASYLLDGEGRRAVEQVGFFGRCMERGEGIGWCLGGDAVWTFGRIGSCGRAGGGLVGAMERWCYVTSGGLVWDR